MRERGRVRAGERECDDKEKRERRGERKREKERTEERKVEHLMLCELNTPVPQVLAQWNNSKQSLSINTYNRFIIGL